MARATETHDEDHESSASKTVDHHGTRDGALTVEAWYSSDNYYKGHEDHMQKRGHDGPRRPISANQGRKGLSPAHMAN